MFCQSFSYLPLNNSTHSSSLVCKLDHQHPRVSHRIDQHDLPVNLLINQADDHRDNLPPNHLVDQPFNQADSPHVNLPPSQHDVQVDNQAVDHHVCQLHNPQGMEPSMFPSRTLPIHIVSFLNVPSCIVVFCAIIVILFVPRHPSPFFTSKRI